MDFAGWTTAGALDGRYVLRARVGSGSRAAVYAADDVRLQRRVAVKVCHDQLGEDCLTRFADEARVLAGLSHPGLVTIYDVCLEAERPYLVMRLIVGGPLSTRTHREGLRPAAVARLGAQLADVLAYVHERGVVHGDIDASNVLVDADGSGYLTGFGIDRGLGRRAGDIYALGMTLAECLPVDLGPEWRTVLAAMTDRDPDARPDAVRCAELLRDIAAGDTAAFPLPLAESAPVEPPTVRVAPVIRPRRPAHTGLARRPAYTGLAGMGLVVTALAVMVATTTTGTSGQPAGEQQPRTPVEQPARTTATPAPAKKAPAPQRAAGTQVRPAAARATPPQQTRQAPPKGRGDGGGDAAGDAQRGDNSGKGSGGSGKGSKKDRG